MGVLTIAFGILLTSCEININHDPEDELVLDSGYAWVTDNTEITIDWFEININVHDDYGYIFKRNGTVILIEEDGSHWDEVGRSYWSVKDHDHIRIGTKTFEFDVDDGKELELNDKHFKKERVGYID